MPDTPETPKKQELKPAATNPWYVLMTVAGEQTGGRIDRDLHARNRRYWNGWAAQALSNEEKKRLFENGQAPEDDFAPLDDEELAAITEALRERCRDARKPKPEDRIDLGKTEFKEAFCASGLLFPQDSVFPCAIFSGDADFGSATFFRYADFGSASFSGDANFESATFSERADFGGAAFSGRADFESVTFSGRAIFWTAVFSGTADFRRTIFSKHADFRNAVFSWEAVLEGAIFSRGALFRRVTFSLGARFGSAKFSEGGVEFDSATFSGAAHFTGVTFSGEAYFESVAFLRGAGFLGATFSKVAVFNDAKFGSNTSFGPLRNVGRTRQSPVRFLRHPPTFFNATLHEDTDFTDVKWPDVPDDADSEERRSRAVSHRRAYERLKLLMDSQKKVADELMFQRLELRCREAEAVGDWREREWWVARVSRLYGLLSDYGWDPVRPALWLGGLVVAGWVLIGIAEWADYNLGGWPDPARPAEYLGFWQSGTVSLSNVFGFLGFNRTFLAEEVRTLTAFSEVVSGAQTVFGLVLLFLFGLALRNRFRIK